MTDFGIDVRHWALDVLPQFVNTPVGLASFNDNVKSAEAFVDPWRIMLRFGRPSSNQLSSLKLEKSYEG